MVAHNGAIVEGHRRYSIEELNNTIKQIEDDNIQYLLMRQERRSKRNQKSILSRLFGGRYHGNLKRQSY